jgi:glycosyltransferase involved in cell wall biosynthesis
MNDKEENPLVSIIVRTKDRPTLLEMALRTVAFQTYRPIEVVLINDGGCDLDVAKLKEILKDVSLNYIRLEKNTGRACAGNIGLENVSGKYIGFLDDDDEFYPEHVSVLVSLLKQVNYKVVYADSLMAYKEYNPKTSELIGIRKEMVFSQDFNYDYLIFENYIPFMCLLFEREVLINSGGFDCDLDIYEDWDLLIRIGEEHAFYHVKQTTADYNQWNTDLQIAQSNKNHDFMEQSYLKVLSKHIRKVSARRILNYSSHLADKNKEPYLKSIETLLAEKETALKSIYNSRGWKVLLVCYRIRDKLLPHGSKRRRLVRQLFLDGKHDTLSAEKDQHRVISENDLREKEAHIQFAQLGYNRKLLNRCLKLRDGLVPAGIKIGLFAKLILKMAAHPGEVFKNLNKANLGKVLYYFKTDDPVTLEKKLNQKLHFYSTARRASEKNMAGRDTAMNEVNKDYFNFLFEMNTKQGEDYVPLSSPNIPATDIRLIAFYLPQFHPIPENDEWWGKGFTEWANVSRAVPQFIGHYQPRLPAELGFYDLRIPEVQKRQIDLAKQYGIYGFCFHFYWFNGKTLLEKPILQFAENYDFPFCINWANENWTRRWDGRDNEILIAQKHSPEDDIAFIEHIACYLKNKNYIRIQSKPLLMIYRPALLPNPKATGERWRKWCLENGIGEIYLAAVRSFDEVDPGSIGFDAVIEFPPHVLPFQDISSQFNLINPDYKGVITDYKGAMEFYLDSVKPPYKKFRGIIPGWDNEARIPGRGKVLANSTPSNFKQWLKNLLYFTHHNFSPEERIIFINAWNEWGEGAYLEPDRRYGYAYLQAVADALIAYAPKKKQKKIIYVCHDAFFAGAQLLSLNILKVLKLTFNYDVRFILKSGGALESEYEKYGPVYNLERDYRTLKERRSLIEYFAHLGFQDAICNTVASGDITELLYEKDIRTITLVHELPDIIKNMKLEKNAKLLSGCSSKIVFPSDFVREKFKTITKIDEEKTHILPQGVYKNNTYKGRKDAARKELREQFSLPESAHVILGAGFGDHRKGVDLFVDVAKMVTKELEGVYFIWVGNLDFEIAKKVGHEVKDNNHIIFRGALQDISLFYAGADIFLLTSREDPFPAVVLEAMDAGLPVIGFSDAGGFRDIVNADTGVLVPYLDVTAMAKEIVSLLADARRRQMLEATTQKLIEEKFNFTDYVYRLLAVSGHEYKKVSVIIPNFNYEKYLKLRIDSILKQTYPIYEIIFLDDASADNSVKNAEGYLADKLNVHYIQNEMNSGSVYKQWMKGLQAAKGDYIWIAEADDLCEDTFLEELMSCFDLEKDVVLAYCQSRQIDEDGKILSENYYEYTNDIDREKWHEDYIREGVREISDTLAVKNSIPNVSAVVFKKIDISPIAHEMAQFRVAGDWFFYVWLLKHGNIAFVSQSLNSHRRHDRGVTKSENNELHFNEVVRMQEHILNNFNVPAATRDKIFSYRDYLISYFILHSKTRPLVRN